MAQLRRALRWARRVLDKVYVVVSGRGLFTAGGRTVEVGPGITLFVPAGEDHRFHDVTEDMTLLVFFAPAYTGRA